MSEKDAMMQTLDHVTAVIDKGINDYFPVPAKEQLKSLEAVHPLLKQAYVVGGAALIPVLLLFYILGGFKLMVNLSGFIYPAYKSLQAISNNDLEEDKQWLTYWVVYGTFSIMESGMSFLTSMIPYYNLFKLAMFIYLYHHSTKGATKVALISSTQFYSLSLPSFISGVRNGAGALHSATYFWREEASEESRLEHRRH
jgi:receptor expression-enhancing protein 5/6